VLHSSRNKDNAAFGYCLIFRAGSHAASAANYVVHFVFFVWRLRIGASSGQHVSSGTHRRDTQKLQVRLPGLLALFAYIRDVKETYQLHDGRLQF
jgi:hypothetical protein